MEEDLRAYCQISLQDGEVLLEIALSAVGSPQKRTRALDGS